MSNQTDLDEPVKPARLTFKQIVDDLASIPINQSDVLFEASLKPVSLELEDSSSQSEDDNESTAASTNIDTVHYDEKLEKLLLFLTNLELESEQTNSDFSFSQFDQEVDSTEKRLDSLKNFIEVSEKFLSINK